MGGNAGLDRRSAREICARVLVRALRGCGCACVKMAAVAAARGAMLPARLAPPAVGSTAARATIRRPALFPLQSRVFPLSPSIARPAALTV